MSYLKNDLKILLVKKKYKADEYPKIKHPLPKPPFCLALIAPTKSGKSNLIVNLLKNPYFGYDEVFEETYYISPTVNLDDTLKAISEDDDIIKIDDALSMKLRYPSLDQFVENNFEFNEDEGEVDKSLQMIVSCIEQVYNEEESWSASDCTKKELQEFVEQMNTKQFKEIEKFFTTMPKLTHTIKVKNPKTKVESDIVLEGLASFFS